MGSSAERYFKSCAILISHCSCLYHQKSTLNSIPPSIPSYILSSQLLHTLLLGFIWVSTEGGSFILSLLRTDRISGSTEPSKRRRANHLRNDNPEKHDLRIIVYLGSWHKWSSVTKNHRSYNHHGDYHNNDISNDDDERKCAIDKYGPLILVLTYARLSKVSSIHKINFDRLYAFLTALRK